MNQQVLREAIYLMDGKRKAEMKDIPKWNKKISNWLKCHQNEPEVLLNEVRKMNTDNLGY